MQADPAPGELYVLAETRDFPVEWALLDRKASGELLAVPVDTNPLVGEADLEIPKEASSGPLVLRCAYGVWLEPSRFDPAHRTGSLDAVWVARALAVWKGVEKGERATSPLAAETEADPEYQDWLRGVVEPARATVEGKAEQARPVQRPARPPRWTSPRNPYAVAASVLLAVGLALGVRSIQQAERAEELAAERDRLRLREEAIAQELSRTQREIVERDRQAQEAERRVAERIADLERRLDKASHPEPMINAPFVYLTPREPVRGPDDGISIPPAASHLFLILYTALREPFTEYRLEILNWENKRLVWSTGGLKKTGVVEVSVALPRSHLPPGDYRLQLYGVKDGQSKLAGEYDLKITRE